MSDSTVDAAIVALQTLTAGLAGIKAAPENPSEAMPQLPFVVTYPARGNVALRSAGFGDYLHTLITEIHLSRNLLPSAIDQAKSYIEPFARLVINSPKISNTVSVVNDIRYTFGFLQWGEMSGTPIYNVGIRFEVDVKILITGTG